MLCVALLALPAQTPSLETAFDLPNDPALVAASEEARRTVAFKIEDGLAAAAFDGRLLGESAEVRAIAARLGDAVVDRLLTQSPEELVELRQRALERGAWPPPPDLSLWFRARTDGPAAAQALVTALAGAPGLAHAYVQPGPAAPPIDLPPTTPDWTDAQDYFEAPLDGTRMFEVSGVFGARGRTVRMTDCEYSWVVDHEDLELTTARYVGGTPIGIWSDHGTAVVGQIYAQDNGYGVTGGTPNCEVYLATEYATTWGFNPTQAIVNAAASSSTGDVILLEMQTYGPTFTFVPEEYTQASFDAIQNATAAGIHVVEAGANGATDLDDPVFNGVFDVNVRDSGAILVGAGQSLQHQVKIWFTNYGERVDCQGWGESIYTAGYGDLFQAGNDDRQDYTSTFGGTSGASPIVTSAVVSLVGAMRAHGMPEPSPFDVREALRQIGSPQPAWDLATGRIGPQPDMEELFDWFQLPDGMRHRGSAELGSSITFTMSGTAGENWTLYAALDSVLLPTAAGTRIVGNQQLTTIANGVLPGTGTAFYSTTVPNLVALQGREVVTQVLFQSAAGPRLSNGGALALR